MARRDITFADLGRDPGAVARDLMAWQRGDRDEAIAQTLAASARETHGKGMTVWVWTGTDDAGTAVWLLPVSVAHAREFAPQGPARVLVAVLAATIDAGADPVDLLLCDWHGWVLVAAPDADPDLAGLAIAERLPADARVGIGVISTPIPTCAEFDLGRARRGTPLADLAGAVGAHPVEVAIALAARGQDTDVPGADPDMVHNLRNWGFTADPLSDVPDDDGSLSDIDHDPCPRRRHARRVLQRLLRMGKVGTNYHTAVDHLYRGAPPDQRHEALAVGEALIRAGLLGEKPSVGQRHVYLRREALPQIHALIDRGETDDPTLAALWTAPPRGSR
jgi:hypothetical protein